MRRSRTIGNYAATMIAVACLVYLLLPLIVMVATSFTETSYLAFPPIGFTFRWYTEVLHNAAYLRALQWSAIVSLGATACAVLLGLPAALGLARSHGVWSSAISAFLLSPLLVPSVIVGAATMQLAYSIGANGSLTPLVAGHLVIVLPYIVRTLMAALGPSTLSTEEAARDLGANAVSAFFLVTLPTIKTALFAGILFSLIISWINVEVSVFNTTTAMETLPVRLFNEIQYSIGPQLAAVSALSVVLAIVVVFVIDTTVGIDKVG